MNTKCAMLVMAVIASFSLLAGTWYVDASRPNDDGDGTSAETAKKTIQAAVSAAESSGEATLVVKVAPGTYDSGEVVDSNGAKNRVVITKKLTLESTGSRDDTFLVGAKGAGSYGLGSDSVRGICADGADAAGSIIRGFTFKDCSAGRIKGSAELSGHGGAVCFNQGTCDVYVKDCAAIDCAAYFGGGFCGVVVLRSMVKGCHNDNTGNGGAALKACKAYNCIFVGNGASDSYEEYILSGNGPYVNCTAVANNGSLLRTSSSQRIYNSISTMANRQEFDGTNNGGANVIAEYGSGSSGFTNYRQVTNNTDSFYKLLVAVMMGDYRPVAGGDAESFGDPQWCELDWIPLEDRNLDYFSNTRVGGGNVDVGAIQGAVAVAGGVLKCRELVKTTGSSTYTRNWHANCGHATWVPTMVRVTPPEGTFCCTVGTDEALSKLKTVRYADRDGGFWQVVPESGRWRVLPVAATATLWVDAESTADAPTGAESAPFRTIQAAVDAADGTGYTIINVKPGTYDDGETVAVGLKSRVAIDRKNVFIRAVGEGDHVIRGEWHESATGCGENAVRCVAIDHGAAAYDYRVAIQGFRLENGATLTDDSSNGARGGAVCAFPFVSTTNCLYAQVLDCSIVNCVGSSTLANSVWLQNCSFSDCPSASAAIRQSVATSCTFRNVAGTISLLAEDSIAVGCSFSGEANGARMPIGANSVSFYNSIIMGGNITREIGAYGTYLYDVKKTDARGVPRDGSIWTDEDPMADFTADGRAPLLRASPAFGRWTVAEARLSGVIAYLGADCDGVPLQVSEDGKVTPGACQAAYDPKDVYVDATKTDDSQDGLTEATAKRTLAGAMAVACSGDTIHVAAGTYDEGEMSQTSAVVEGTAFNVKARVVVPRHATLVGAGSDRTTIRGGFVQDVESTLVRCVILGAGATLGRATVANGLCVTNSSGSASDDGYAAGVLADRSSIVEDCLIEGNRSYRYGAVYGGTFRRCTFRGNWAMQGANAVSVGSVKVLENCLATGNRGGTIVADYYTIDNCTFLYDNVQLNGTSRIDRFGSYASGARISNSALILSPTAENTQVPDLYNCLLPKLGSNSWRWSPISANNCLLSETAFSASWDGEPTEDGYIGLDRGSNVYAPAGADLANAQRIQNAVVDIGAYEYNWMPTYSAAFSRRGWAEVVATAGAVTKATPAGISFGADGSLTAIMRNDPGRDVVIEATVAEGALVVSVNGVERGRLTSGLARLGLGELHVGDRIELAFADAGSAVIAGLRSVSGLVVTVH